MTVEYGDAVTCTIDTSGDTDVFRYSATDGEVVFLQIADGNGLNPFPVIQFDVFGPVGQPLGFSISELVLQVDVSTEGIHTVIVSEQGDDDTTGYTFALERLVPPTANATTMTYGSALTGTVDPIGDLDLYSFSGQAGEVVFAQIADGNGLNPFPVVTIQLFDPQGSSLSLTSSNTVIELTSSGLHTILISENDREDTSNYTIALERLVPPSQVAPFICYGCTEVGDIEPLGDVDLFFFLGTPGDLISLALGGGGAGNPFPVTTMTLFDPFGNVLDSDETDIILNLTDAGLHTVLVNELDRDQTVSYDLTLQCIVGMCLEPEIFADGFETGDTTRWSASVPPP